jgi:hypothetical protein
MIFQGLSSWGRMLKMAQGRAGDAKPRLLGARQARLNERVSSLAQGSTRAARRTSRNVGAGKGESLFALTEFPPSAEFFPRWQSECVCARFSLRATRPAPTTASQPLRAG